MVVTSALSNSEKVGIVSEVFDDDIDAAAVRKLKGGHALALKGIYLRHEAAVLRFLVASTGDPDAARDLCQEVFLAFHAGVRRYRHEGKLRAWLLGIASRKSLAHRRKLARRAALMRRLSSFMPKPGPAPTSDDRLRTDEHVRALIGALDPSLREVLLMQVCEGMSGEEIASALGLSHGAVRVRLHRARQKIRDRIVEFQEADQ